MASIPSINAPQTNGNNGANYRGSFVIMTSLFFLWGFMTVFNDILIPRFKEAFTLTYFQALLVQFAFFGAYFVGSLIYFIISITTGDPIAKLGYKTGVDIGLLIAATGAGLFWPAAVAMSSLMFLGALFIVGLGLAFTQTNAPLPISLVAWRCLNPASERCRNGNCKKKTTIVVLGIYSLTFLSTGVMAQTTTEATVI